MSGAVVLLASDPGGRVKVPGFRSRDRCGEQNFYMATIPTGGRMG